MVPIILKLIGNLIEVNDEQYSNDLSSIDVTLSGIIILDNFVFEENVSTSITCMFFGNLTLTIFVQL